VQIAQSLIDEMIAHAREDLPNECCGLIGGNDDQALVVHRVRNEAESPLRYRMHGQDEYDARKAIAEAGEEVMAAYHSHTKTPAYPSQTDVNEAVNWPELLYLIVSLKDPDVPEVKAYWLKDLKIADAELIVT
jgi:[CysO sulfur-carrier protein]-S-L-cysteine hydrolase